ncbi:MAG: tetratricopeptide repeat protein [Dissulfurispiraceae bacterium]|jgi:tetratricopeptide (TPR) repeat protein
MMNADFFIEKLRERVLESSGSRLFLTLAEELKKRGEYEEALMVLKHGVEKNPSFVAARITLGRWYLKDNRLDDARKEFSAVIESSPGDKVAIRYLRDIEAEISTCKGDARRRTIDRLNQFREAIHKRFNPAIPIESPAGDR